MLAPVSRATFSISRADIVFEGEDLFLLRDAFDDEPRAASAFDALTHLGIFFKHRRGFLSRLARHHEFVGELLAALGEGVVDRPRAISKVEASTRRSTNFMSTSESA
jgi:hypothetical protein